MTLSHYDHLWRWWGCLAIAESLSASFNRSSRGSAFRGRLACHLILADGHPGQNMASAATLAYFPNLPSGMQFRAASSVLSRRRRDGNSERVCYATNHGA